MSRTPCSATGGPRTCVQVRIIITRELTKGTKGSPEGMLGKGGGPYLDSSFAAPLTLASTRERYINPRPRREIPRFRIFSLLNHESESERKSPRLNLFRKRGLLLWPVRAQHDRCESKCERKSGGIYYLPCHYIQKRMRKQVSRHSFVIIFVWMVLSSAFQIPHM